MVLAVIALGPTGCSQIQMAFERMAPGSGTASQPAESAVGTLRLELGQGVYLALAPIAAGRFLMGSPEDEPGRRVDEPQREVAIARPFWMGITEVTQAQWQAIMGTRPWQDREIEAEGPDLPAVFVSWDDAVEFCRRVSLKTGRDVRLPTEVQWEYACRAGSTEAFSFGADASRLPDHAWVHANTYALGHGHPQPVGTKPANAWDLYDMHGNVLEWCRDLYVGPLATPTPDEPPDRVVRGGCFGNKAAAHCRCAMRTGDPQTKGSRFIGFRVMVAD